MITFELSRPPSVNNLFFNLPRRGRARTPAYNEWRSTAGWELLVLKPRKSVGPVEITIEVSSKARGDTANYEKATVDLLVAHKVIEGDNHKIVKKVTMAQTDGIKGVRVTIKPAEKKQNGELESN